jgi:hypothetical protein
MSEIGKTLLRGHALRDEGHLRYTDEGIFRWQAEHAKCECGALSPVTVTNQYQAKRWHREHKDSFR